MLHNIFQKFEMVYALTMGSRKVLKLTSQREWKILKYPPCTATKVRRHHFKSPRTRNLKEILEVFMYLFTLYEFCSLY